MHRVQRAINLAVSKISSNNIYLVQQVLNESNCGFNNYNKSSPFTLNELRTYDTVKFSK